MNIFEGARRVELVIGVTTIIASIAALFFLFFLSSYPANIFQCRMDAAKARTVSGVATANDACNEKFREEIAVQDEHKREKMKRRINAFFSNAMPLLAEKPLLWPDVIAKPEYQALSDADKAAARDEYFQTFIQPNIAIDERHSYQERFNKEAAKVENATKK